VAWTDAGPVRMGGFSVDTVDTTGAGDCFNAGFLHAWRAGFGIVGALRFACACGAISTLGIGGTGSQPSAQQVHDFLRSRHMNVAAIGVADTVSARK